MKYAYLKNFIVVVYVMLSNNAFSQNWRVGGNTAAQMGGQPSILGTLGGNNLALNIYTNGSQRMVINPNLTSATTVAAGNQPKNGFVGINTTDPWSRLHILNGTNAICAGYRAWMREGLNIQTNDDMLWFGHRRWGATNPDQQNAMINWSEINM